MTAFLLAAVNVTRAFLHAPRTATRRNAVAPTKEENEIDIVQLWYVARAPHYLLCRMFFCLNNFLFSCFFSFFSCRISCCCCRRSNTIPLTQCVCVCVCARACVNTAFRSRPLTPSLSRCSTSRTLALPPSPLYHCIGLSLVLIFAAPVLLMTLRS